MSYYKELRVYHIKRTVSTERNLWYITLKGIWTHTEIALGDIMLKWTLDISYQKGHGCHTKRAYTIYCTEGVEQWILSLTSHSSFVLNKYGTQLF